MNNFVCFQVRKLAFRSRGRTVQSLDIGGPRVETPQSGDDRLFLQIKPALADPRTAHPAIQRSSTILTG